MANLSVTYFLWFFGGILGLHHAYLNRPRHCFIWFVTWGGMVLGWISEVARIKEYVDETNETAEYKKRMKEIKHSNPRPELTVGFLGLSLLIGHQLANLAVNSIPDVYITDTWYGPYLAHVLAAIGASVGVYLVANIGTQKAPFWLPCLAAVCTFPVSYFLFHKRPVINLICVMMCGYVSSEYAEWDKKRKPKKFEDFLKIWGAFVAGILLYGSLWSSNMYYNYRVPTLNGTRIPLRQAMFNFMQTKPYDEANEAMWDILPCLKLYPYDTCLQNFVARVTELSDPGKTGWALEVLGLDQIPDEKAISSHCRKLSRQYHPDRIRNKNKEETEEAQKKFMDIQKACSALSKVKMNRERKSQWATNDQRETVVNHDDVINDIHSKEDDVKNDIDSDEDDITQHSDDDIEKDVLENESNSDDRKRANLKQDFKEDENCDFLNTEARCDGDQCTKFD